MSELADALRASELDIVCKETIAQVQAGTDIIYVNVSTIGVDDEILLPRAVQAIMDTLDIPLCLDSPNPKAIEAALKRRFPMRPSPSVFRQSNQGSAQWGRRSTV